MKLITQTFTATKRRRRRADKPSIYQLDEHCSPIFKLHLHILQVIYHKTVTTRCGLFYLGDGWDNTRIGEKDHRHILVLLENCLILETEDRQIIITNSGRDLLTKHNKIKTNQPNQSSLDDIK